MIPVLYLVCDTIKSWAKGWPIFDMPKIRKTGQPFVHDCMIYNISYIFSEHQTELIDNIAALLFQEPGVYRTLIIDSIIALFRVDYQGQGSMFHRLRAKIHHGPEWASVRSFIPFKGSVVIISLKHDLRLEQHCE